MPAVNSAGNTRIDQIDRPFDASAAEMPSNPISVAVSKPSPNKSPSGYMCQLREINRNRVRNSRLSSALGEKDVKLLLGIIFPAVRPPEDAKDTDQHDEVDHRDGEEKNHRDQRANKTAGLDQSGKA